MARPRCRAMTDRHLRYVCQGKSLPQPHLLCLRSVLFIRDRRDHVHVNMAIEAPLSEVRKHVIQPLIFLKLNCCLTSARGHRPSTSYRLLHPAKFNIHFAQ